MANDKFIDKITKGSETYTIHAELAENANTATVAETAEYAEKANKIGNNVSTYSVVDTKPREGLKFTNNGVEAIIDLNYKSKDGTGNLELDAKNGHVNIESKKGIQIKPTTTIIFDSSRRIEDNKGNEINVEAKFDDWNDRTDPEYNGKDGYNEKWAELKIKSRNLDLRCNDHGGIALQIAGKDKTDKENKIKFESNRINSILEVGAYSQDGEGGKGLEFGTFNNEHTSLYTKDYRFRGDADVYGVTRGELETSSSGKIDYPTQGDDFKDITDENNKATWNEIISAANKCKGKEAIASENYVNAQIAQAQLPEGEVDLSAYATTEYVDNAIASAGGGAALEAGNGITISEGRISVNNYSNIEPLTALTNNVAALDYIKIGNSKGNFAVDVTGKYTYELTSPKSATTRDEHEIVHSKGERILMWDNEAFYADEYKVYYKALVEAELDDSQNASELAAVDTIVWVSDCELTFDENCGYNHYEISHDKMSFYEDESKYVYKGKKNISIKYGKTTPISKGETLDPSTLSEDELTYYDGQVAVYDEDGNLISGWEKLPVWKKSTLWSVNEININLETDSKIKFAGNKIEAVWTVDDVDRKMEDILLSTNTLSVDANDMVFEQKISKNGDREGQDTVLSYTFTNNVADPEKVANFNEFKTNYNKKHTPKDDAELQEMYEAFLAEGGSFEIRVKVSELLGLVSKVAELEARIETLEGNSVAE